MLQTILFNLCFCFEDTRIRPVGLAGQGLKHFLHSYFFTSSALLRQIIDQVLLQEDRLHVLHHLNLFEDRGLGELRGLRAFNLVPQYAVDQSQWSPSISASSDEDNVRKIRDMHLSFFFAKVTPNYQNKIFDTSFQNQSQNLQKAPALWTLRS